MLTGPLGTQTDSVMTGVQRGCYGGFFGLGRCAGLRTSVVVTRDIFRVSGFNVIIMDNYFQV